MSNEKQTSENTQGHAPLSGVSCRFLDVGDVVYYHDFYGVLNHNYTSKPTEVLKGSKTLAYLDNGKKAFRKPRKHASNDGYHWSVKNGGAVYPNGN